MDDIQSHEWVHEARVSCNSCTTSYCRTTPLVHPTTTPAESSEGRTKTTIMRGMHERLDETPSLEGVKTRRFDADPFPSISTPNSSGVILTTAAASQASSDSLGRFAAGDICSEESQGFLSSLWLCLRKDPQQALALVGGMVVLIQRHIRRGQVFLLDHCRVAEVVDYGKYIILPPEEFLSTAYEAQVTEANLLFVVGLLEYWLPEIECSQLSKCEIEELIRHPSQLLKHGHQNGLQELASIARKAMR